MAREHGSLWLLSGREAAEGPMKSKNMLFHEALALPLTGHSPSLTFNLLTGCWEDYMR